MAPRNRLIPKVYQIQTATAWPFATSAGLPGQVFDRQIGRQSTDHSLTLVALIGAATVTGVVASQKAQDLPVEDLARPHFFGYPCHTYSSASGKVCAFTVRSVWPAFSANTNW